MIYKVFAIKDKALDSYSAPFTQATVEAGLRMWRDLVLFGQDDNRYKRSPDDYTLYMVGTYDDETAQLNNEASPVRISSANEVLAENTQPTED